MPNVSFRSWNELPAELLQYVLREVKDHKSIFQCLLVCKAWSKSAERFSYHTIDVSSYNTQLKRIVDILQSSKHLGNRVRKINFKIKMSKDGDPKGYFEKLVDCCPNVKVITATDLSCHWLWTHLLVKKQKWKNLQEIPRPFYNYNMEMYTRTALEFNDRLSTLTLVIQSGLFMGFVSNGNLRTDLPTYLSTFKCLKHLEIHRANGLMLEEVDIILNSCPNLDSFTVLRDCENMTSDYDSFLHLADRPLALSDKIDLFKPKTGLRKLNFSFTNEGGNETLIYIMRVLPNLESLHLNQVIDNINMVCSGSVIVLFLQYSLNIKFVNANYLSCENAASLLPVYWQSEAYKVVNKEEVYLGIEESHSIVSRSHKEPYISMYSRREVTISYKTFGETSSPIELIEKVGSFLTNLRVAFNYPHYDSTRTVYQGYFLDHIFKYCPLLKRIECSFYILESCNPNLSINTSIEEFVLNSIEVHPAVFEQLSIRLPNLKVMLITENAFMKYGEKFTQKKKLDINMQYTKFDKLYIAKKPKKQYSDLFLKYSNENGDKYFYTDFTSDFTGLCESSQMDYYGKLTSRSTYFLNVRCQALHELTILFDSIKIKFLL